MNIKKIFPVFLISFFILSACAPLTNLIKKAERDYSNTSTSLSSSELESSSSSSSKEESKEVISRTLTGKEDGLERTDTVTYQGDTFLSLKVVAIDDFPEEARESIDRLGREVFNEVWQEAIKQDQTVIKAQELEGFELSYEVTEDNRVKMTMIVDMQKIDEEKVSELDLIKGLDIKEIKNTSPTLYIAALKFDGFKEVK